MREIATLSTLSRENWLEVRRQGVGSSDAPIILGLSTWKSPLALWADKTGIAIEEEAEEEYREWGRILEPVIADKYHSVTGRKLDVPTSVYQHQDFDWMLGNPDRFIRERGDGILEIKTAAAFKSGDWADEPPLPHQVQIQHLFAVTGLKWGSFAVLIGGQKFRWCDVERHDRFISYLIEKEAEFWDRVIRGIPPSVDASDSSREVLSRLYPRDTGETIELPPEAIAWDEQLQFAKAEIKAAEHRKQDAENKLKAAIGNATIGLLPGGGGYTWKASERKGYIVEPTTVRTLRRIK
jgi:putative phage-type endonuclease